MDDKKRTRILIIDDEERLLRVLRLGLGGRGFEITCASAAEEGLKLILSKPFDVVLTDLRLEGMSGLELVFELERLQIHLPVIMMTAFADVTSAVKALKHGACDYIQKPFSIDEIEKLIRECLAKSPAKEEPPLIPLDEGVSLKEKEMILKALEQSGHVKAQAAKLLKISERSLWYKLKKYNIQ